jgi:hypothetical protein
MITPNPRKHQKLMNSAAVIFNRIFAQKVVELKPDPHETARV